MKRFLKLILILLLLLVGVLMFNTLRFASKQVYETVQLPPRVADSTISHLLQAIKHKTISNGDPALFDSSAFHNFHLFLEQTYPLTHRSLTLEHVGFSLLYKWTGKDSSRNPFVLMAHQDVVPIEEATRGLWTVDPFEGVVKDEFIWGRGSADDKINVIAILEAVEKLLGDGFQPPRTIYLAFGYDEEVGGTGARAMAALLHERNITADLVLDEGGIITLDKVPGITKPVALIGTAEKGYLSLELTVEKNGGHSSMPEKETALDILSKALVAIHDHPFDAGFSTPTEGFLNHVGPEMPYPEKIVFANTWLFKPIVIGIYEKSPGGNALVRTTSAATIIHAGIKDNVVPSKATATVNFRLLPGDDSKKVIQRITEIINDERVKIGHREDFVAEPSAVTPADGFGFNLVSKIVHRTMDNTIVTPFLMIGGTDSRHMELISTQVIKFSPMTDPIGFHGIDERVSIESFGQSLWFFENLIRSSD